MATALAHFIREVNRLNGASKTALSGEEFTAKYGHLPQEQRTMAVDGRRKDVREGGTQVPDSYPSVS